MFTLHSLQVPPPGRVQQYTAGPPMAATGPPSMAATGPALPPPVPVVGTLIVRGKFEFRSVSEIRGLVYGILMWAVGGRAGLHVHVLYCMIIVLMDYFVHK